jgi:hypothetical protein
MKTIVAAFCLFALPTGMAQIAARVHPGGIKIAPGTIATAVGRMLAFLGEIKMMRPDSFRALTPKT